MSEEEQCCGNCEHWGFQELTLEMICWNKESMNLGGAQKRCDWCKYWKERKDE